MGCEKGCCLYKSLRGRQRDHCVLHDPLRVVPLGEIEARKLVRGFQLLGEAIQESTALN